MKYQFYAMVGQDSFSRRIVDSAIAFQRPNAFYQRCECRLDRIFAIARLTHYIVDLIAFASSDSSGAFLVNPNARLHGKSTGRCADSRNAKFSYVAYSCRGDDSRGRMWRRAGCLRAFEARL